MALKAMFTALTEKLSSGLDHLLQRSGRVLLGVVIIVNLSLIIITNRVTLNDFPNIVDEYVYQLSAQMFAQGTLQVPSPEPQDFFSVTHMFNDGNFYGKYPPGWPFVLSMGYAVGIPWLINPILTTFMLLLLYWAAKEHFSQQVANIVLLISLANPFLVFNSASYNSHPACLFWIALFIFAYLRLLKDSSNKMNYFLLGMSGGLAFLTRPYTACAMLVPLGVHLVYYLIAAKQGRALIRGLIFCVLPLALCAFVFISYNHALTGNPFLQPFTKYDPADKPNILLSVEGLEWAFIHNVGLRLVELSIWLPLSVVFITAYLLMRRTITESRGLMILSASISAFVAYFFYLTHGGGRYGPRYVYETAFPLLLISSIVLSRIQRTRMLLIGLVVALNVGVFMWSSWSFAQEIRHRTEPFELVKQKGITNAIIFLETGSGGLPPGSLVRNGLHFDGDILYVRDLRGRNNELLLRYPGRSVYFFAYDDSTEKGRLLRYDPSRDGR